MTKTPSDTVIVAKSLHSCFRLGLVSKLMVLTISISDIIARSVMAINFADRVTVDETSTRKFSKLNFNKILRSKIKSESDSEAIKFNTDSKSKYPTFDFRLNNIFTSLDSDARAAGIGDPSACNCECCSVPSSAMLREIDEVHCALKPLQAMMGQCSAAAKDLIDVTLQGECKLSNSEINLKPEITRMSNGRKMMGYHNFCHWNCRPTQIDKVGTSCSPLSTQDIQQISFSGSATAQIGGGKHVKLDKSLPKIGGIVVSPPTEDLNISQLQEASDVESDSGSDFVPSTEQQDNPEYDRNGALNQYTYEAGNSINKLINKAISGIEKLTGTVNDEIR